MCSTVGHDSWLCSLNDHVGKLFIINPFVITSEICIIHYGNHGMGKVYLALPLLVHTRVTYMYVSPSVVDKLRKMFCLWIIGDPLTLTTLANKDICV